MEMDPPRSTKPPSSRRAIRRRSACLKDMANDVVTAAEKKRDPYLDIPARNLSNVKYNRVKRFIEMGNATNRRQLFNLSQAKSYMQTMLVASGCKRADRASQNDQLARYVLPAEAHDRRHEGRNVFAIRANATR